MKYKTGITEIADRKTVKGSGCFGKTLGVGAGIFYIIVGILISLTGIGAIIGIPLIIGASMLMFWSAAPGHIIFKGVCPYCGHNIEGNLGAVFDCVFCKERVMIGGDKLYTKETFSERD